MKIFSLDIETTGLSPENDQILELGCIFEDTANPKSYEDCEKFHAILKHERLSGNPFALQLNNRLLRIISEVDQCPEGCQMFYDDFPETVVHSIEFGATTYGGSLENQLKTAFANWAKPLVGEGNNFRLNIAGKNVSFDLNFLEPHFGKKLFRHRTLDVGNFYADPTQDSVPGLTKCLEIAGFGQPTELHSALGDCWDVIKLVRRHWNYGLDLLGDGGVK